MRLFIDVDKEPFLIKRLKALKELKSNSFLDEAFGFIDKCGAKPRIFSQNQSQSHKKRLFFF